MPERDRAFSWPYLTSAIALVLGLFWVGWGMLRLGQRELELADLALKHTIFVVRGEVQHAFDQVDDDLRLEAAYVSSHDSIPRSALLDRWSALLSSRWAIAAIRLADDRGNEFALLRDSIGTILRETATGSEYGPPLLIHLVSGQPVDSANGVAIGDSLIDPRAENWYSRALEDRRGDPVWTLAPAPDSAGSARMIVALLIRPRSDEQPFRILSFTVRPQRVLATVHPTDPMRSYLPLVLSEEGRSLLPTAPEIGRGDRIRSTALALWDPELSSVPQYFTVDGSQLVMRSLPVNIGGVTIHVGSLIDVDDLHDRFRPERLFLAGAILLYLVLLTLMVLVYLRNRRDLGRLREQQKRSRTQQRKLAKVIGERDMLDREVHHRVKNNLQVLSSLLNLQAQRVEEGPTRNEFLRGKRRIDIMALVHQKLYGMPDLRGIDLERFFDELSASVAALYPKRSNVSYAFDTDRIRSDPDTAIELGIILCELMANCFQHAFPFVTGGHIDVSVRQVEGQLHRLVVKDNGTGLDGDEAHRPGKLGLEIVDALAEKLDGSFKYRSNGGTTFDVLFRMKH
ncbi:MAG: sensor histidine kinase [Flavobacteriales bacterium]|nr:sensor histidine kinase [Flavobacteriales bacterium]